MAPFVFGSDRERIRRNALFRRAAERSDQGVVAETLTFFRYARSPWLGFDQFWDPLPGEDSTPDDDDTESPANWSSFRW